MPDATPTRPEYIIEFFMEYKDGHNLFHFTVDPAITEIIKNQPNTTIKTSALWPGLQFFAIPDMIKSKEYQSLLRQYHLFDDFGHSIMRNEEANEPQFNIAWLRTVGGTGTIEMPSKLAPTEATELIKNTTTFVKDYFEDWFREYKIGGKVTIKL